MCFLSWIFILIAFFITTPLCVVMFFIGSFKLILFITAIIVYLLGNVCDLYLSNRLHWGHWPIEHRWEKFKTSYLVDLITSNNIDYEDIDMDSLEKASTQEFLSLYRKERNRITFMRLKKHDFFSWHLPIKRMSNLDNFCFKSVVFVAFIYRIVLNVFLLPLKIILTQFFFIVFLVYYIKLYLLTSYRELRIPDLQRFTESNFVLRYVFKGIIFEPLENNVKPHYQDWINKRREEWYYNPKRQWISYTLYYYVIWHIFIVPYYGAFDHLQALNFILSNKRQCRSDQCKTHLWVVPNTNTRVLTVLFLILYLITLPAYKLHTWLSITIFNSYRLHYEFGKIILDDGEWVFNPKEIEGWEEFFDLLRKPFYSIEDDLNVDRSLKIYINVCQKTLMKDHYNHIFSVTMVGEFPLHAWVKVLQDEITLVKYPYYKELINVMTDALEKAKKKYNIY